MSSIAADSSETSVRSYKYVWRDNTKHNCFGRTCCLHNQETWDSGIKMETTCCSVYRYTLHSISASNKLAVTIFGLEKDLYPADGGSSFLRNIATYLWN